MMVRSRTLQLLTEGGKENEGGEEETEECSQAKGEQEDSVYDNSLVPAAASEAAYCHLTPLHCAALVDSAAAARALLYAGARIDALDKVGYARASEVRK